MQLTAENRLANLSAYSIIIDKARREIPVEQRAAINNLMNRISSLRQRIRDLEQVGDKCLAYGIPLITDANCFVSDCIVYHNNKGKVGFIVECHDIIGIGCRRTERDAMIKATTCVGDQLDIECEEEDPEKLIADLKCFLQGFDVFEANFYGYVDEITSHVRRPPEKIGCDDLGLYNLYRALSQINSKLTKQDFKDSIACAIQMMPKQSHVINDADVIEGRPLSVVISFDPTKDNDRFIVAIVLDEENELYSASFDSGKDISNEDVDCLCSLWKDYSYTQSIRPKKGAGAAREIPTAAMIESDNYKLDNLYSLLHDITSEEDRKSFHADLEDAVHRAKKPVSVIYDEKSLKAGDKSVSLDFLFDPDKAGPRFSIIITVGNEEPLISVPFDMDTDITDEDADKLLDIWTDHSYICSLYAEY